MRKETGQNDRSQTCKRITNPGEWDYSSSPEELSTRMTAGGFADARLLAQRGQKLSQVPPILA